MNANHHHALADYCGTQPAFEEIPAVDLWTLNRPLPGHPKGSTVSAATMREVIPGMPDFNTPIGHSYALELGTILRWLPQFWPHPLMNLRDAYSFKCANSLWSKQDTFGVLVRANMEAGCGWGHGNKAARRLLALRAQRLGLSIEDYTAYVRDMAEIECAEAQRSTQAWFLANQRHEAEVCREEAPL